MWSLKVNLLEGLFLVEESSVNEKSISKNSEVFKEIF